jgi:hypothetical protein
MPKPEPPGSETGKSQRAAPADSLLKVSITPKKSGSERLCQAQRRRAGKIPHYTAIFHFSNSRFGDPGLLWSALPGFYWEELRLVLK